MATAHDVARYFISLSEENSPMAVTPLKLQKLVYYAQGIHLGEKGKTIFDDRIEAWRHGPVVSSLYHYYKEHKGFTIPSKQLENEDIIFNRDELETLNKVWEKYGDLDGKFLEELTHQEDPWLFTNHNQTIDIKLIREYFQSQLLVTN